MCGVERRDGLELCPTHVELALLQRPGGVDKVLEDLRQDAAMRAEVE